MPADIQEGSDTKESIVDTLADDVETSFELYEKNTNIIFEDINNDIIIHSQIEPDYYDIIGLDNTTPNQLSNDCGKNSTNSFNNNISYILDEDEIYYDEGL